MTAYGRGEYTADDTRFTAELKSVNNRYRDIVLRLPKTLHIIEDEIRALIAPRIKRGRIEVSIQIEKEGAEVEYGLALNQRLVKSYLGIFQQLKDEFGYDQKISPEAFCQMKDVILFKPEDADIDKIRPGIQEVMTLALDSHEAMRTQEGKAIEEDFNQRLQLIQGYLDYIEGQAPIIVENYEKRLKEKIVHISKDIDIDENRLIQEVAIFADRCDITEETVRTRSHLSQFEHYLAMDDAIGRRLDFLMQEINREVNTMSAKATDSTISAKAVEIKAELEKIREQIQNVE